jgi:hypothetical protein
MLRAVRHRRTARGRLPSRAARNPPSFLPRTDRQPRAGSFVLRWSAHLNDKPTYAASRLSGARPRSPSSCADSRDGVQLVEHVEVIDGRTVFEHACRLGLEGIVSKRRDAIYLPGRSRTWLKIKNPASPAASGSMMGDDPIPARRAACRDLHTKQGSITCPRCRAGSTRSRTCSATGRRACSRPR